MVFLTIPSSVFTRFPSFSFPTILSPLGFNVSLLHPLQVLWKIYAPRKSEKV